MKSGSTFAPRWVSTVVSLYAACIANLLQKGEEKMESCPRVELRMAKQSTSHSLSGSFPKAWLKRSSIFLSFRNWPLTLPLCVCASFPPSGPSVCPVLSVWRWVSHSATATGKEAGLKAVIYHESQSATSVSGKNNICLYIWTFQHMRIYIIRLDKAAFHQPSWRLRSHERQRSKAFIFRHTDASRVIDRHESNLNSQWRRMAFNIWEKSDWKAKIHEYQSHQCSLKF